MKVLSKEERQLRDTLEGAADVLGITLRHDITDCWQRFEVMGELSLADANRLVDAMQTLGGHTYVESKIGAFCLDQRDEEAADAIEDLVAEMGSDGKYLSYDESKAFLYSLAEYKERVGLSLVLLLIAT